MFGMLGAAVIEGSGVRCWEMLAETSSNEGSFGSVEDVHDLISKRESGRWIWLVRTL
jgi:hypothetical protein